MDSILKHILDGNTILFLGSGFSLDAKNALGAAIPSVSKLVGEVLDAVGMPKYEAEGITDPLTDVVDFCLSTEDGAISVVSRLRQLFTVVELSEWQQDLISSFPWKRIYTTNFDNAVEVACANRRKHITVLSAMAPFEKPPSGGVPTVVHINGAVSGITPRNIDSQIRLSGKSYASNEFVSSKWAQLLSTDLAYCDSAVFIGFSVGDLDIGRIVVSHLSKAKTHFFNGGGISKMARAKLDNFGIVHDQKGEDFCRVLKKEVVGKSANSAATNYICFEKIRIKPEASRPDDMARRDLLIYGRSSAELIQSTLLGPIQDSYLFERSIESEAIVTLKAGNDVAVLSALGNGKSTLLKRLALKLVSVGWDVYNLSDSTGNWLKEVEAMCGLKGNVAVLIDGAADCMSQIEAIGQRRSGNLRLLLGERTRRYESRFTDQRMESLGIKEVVEYEIDLLDDAERDAFDELISDSGLWGRQAELTKAQRLVFLRHQCRNEVSSALLHVVRSEDIAQRIKIELKSDRLTHSDFQVLSVGVALSVFGFRLSILDLSRLCGSNETNQLLRYSSEFRERLYDARGGEFRVNSKIFGLYFLRDLVSSRLVLGALTHAIRNSLQLGVKLSEVDLDQDDGESKDDRFLRTANSFPAPMYVFRNIQQIVKIDGDFDSIFTFYEEIKRKSRLADDPLFWLQYAIAKLFGGDQASAKSYLDNSYGIAKRTGFKTYQIDNQYARWLLESAASTGDTVEAYTAFDEAHRIIVGQMASHEQAHYPFRIAMQYRDFYLRHQHALDERQTNFVKNAALAVLSASNFAHVELGKRHWVDRCRRALNDLIKASERRNLSA
jgi:hypothetical protein